MKVLITGGLGFIGFQLGKYLANLGREVVLLDNMSVGKYDDEVVEAVDYYKGRLSVVQADLLKGGLEIETDYIIHLAGEIGTKDNQSKANTIIENNFLMTKAILDAIEGTDVKLLFASSQEVKYIPSDITPRWYYAFSKLACENLIKSRAKNWNIVRFSNVYGPRTLQNYVIPNTVKRLEKLNDGDDMVVYSPKDTRPFIHVDDVCFYLWNIIASPLSNQILDIGNPTSISIKKLTVLLARALDKNINLICQKNNNVETREVSMDDTNRILGIKHRFIPADIETFKYRI